GGAGESYLGQRILSRCARYRLLSRPESSIHKVAGEDLVDLTPLMLYEAARDVDEMSRRILAWAGHKLGVALGSAVNLLDIRKIVVGGGLSAAGEFILEPARQSIQDYVMPRSEEHTSE